MLPQIAQSTATITATPAYHLQSSRTRRLPEEMVSVNGRHNHFRST